MLNRMLKWPFSKAAASEGPRRSVLTPDPELSNSSFVGYVEGLSDARTLHGKRVWRAGVGG